MPVPPRKRVPTLRGQKPRTTPPASAKEPSPRTTPPVRMPSVRTTPASRTSAVRTTPPARGTEPPGTPSLEDIEGRLALDDLSGALELARARLAAVPNDRRSAGIVRRCEETLTEMYLSRIGDLKQWVHVKMSGRELRWLSIDHRAGFMLSRVDGPITVEELLEICGMPRLDALRILHDLLQQKVITLASDE